MNPVDPNKPRITPIFPVQPPKSKIDKAEERVKDILADNGYSNHVAKSSHITIWVDSNKHHELSLIRELLLENGAKETKSTLKLKGIEVEIALNTQKHAY